jgi:copper(I)-binding protein
MKPYHIGAAALLLAVPALAKAPAVHVEGWARAGASSAAAYVTVHNGQRVADRLLGAASPAARSVTIHNSTMAGGVMRMRAAGALPVAANGRIAMKPGGLHVMLMGLKAPLRPGTRLPLTLRFERAGNVQVSLPVLPPGATGPAEAHGGH